MNPEYIFLNWDSQGKAPNMEFVFSKRSWMTGSEACPELLYHLHVLQDGRGFCTCPDFKFRGARESKPCKHLRSLNNQKKIVKA